MYIHMYMIGHLNSSLGLRPGFQTPLMFCMLQFHHDLWALQFKVDSERLFERLLMPLLFTLSFWQKPTERNLKKKKSFF